jgi:RHS repeat-associated protein
MNARYYDSGIGRFVSQDPEFWKMSKLDIQLVDPQSWNSYTYARNNPLANVDPTGNFSINSFAFQLSSLSLFFYLHISILMP